MEQLVFSVPQNMGWLILCWVQSLRIQSLKNYLKAYHSMGCIFSPRNLQPTFTLQNKSEHSLWYWLQSFAFPLLVRLPCYKHSYCMAILKGCNAAQAGPLLLLSAPSLLEMTSAQNHLAQSWASLESEILFIDNFNFLSSIS